MALTLRGPARGQALELNARVELHGGNREDLELHFETATLDISGGLIEGSPELFSIRNEQLGWQRSSRGLRFDQRGKIQDLVVLSGEVWVATHDAYRKNLLEADLQLSPGERVAVDLRTP